MKAGVSLYIAAPPFLILLLSYFIPYAFIGALTLALSYFLSYAFISEQLREKTRHRRYRYSFLRFLMGFILVWDFFKRGHYLPLKRLAGPLLFSLFQVALMGPSFWYLPLCALAGWGLFEIYYRKVLEEKLNGASSDQPDHRDDHEIPQASPSAESASEVPPVDQSPQIDSEKNS